MQTYDSEEIKAYVAHCKKKGIQDSSRLFWLQSAMRAGTDKNVLEILEDPKLTNFDAFRILACAIIDIPENLLREIAKAPDTIADQIHKYYEEKYEPDRKKIYQEIFDSFQVQWQQNFSQLLKQTELLSETQEFLKDQIVEREERIATLQRSIDELRDKVRQEKRRAENLEQEKEKWTYGQTDEITEQPLLEKELEQNVIEQHEPGKVVKFLQCNFQKSQEERLIALIRPLEDEQIEEVLDGLEKGLDYKAVKRYASPGNTVKKMREIKNLLLKERRKNLHEF